MLNLANTMENQGLFSDLFSLKERKEPLWTVCFLSISPSGKYIKKKTAHSTRLAEEEEKGSEITMSIYVSVAGGKRVSKKISLFFIGTTKLLWWCHCYRLRCITTYWSYPYCISSYHKHLFTHIPCRSQAQTLCHVFTANFYYILLICFMFYDQTGTTFRAHLYQWSSCCYTTSLS